MSSQAQMIFLKEMSDFYQSFSQSFQRTQEYSDIQLGTTSKSEVYREDKLALYKYSSGKKTHKRPLLIVYALVNTPYMMDLQPDRSMIKSLTDEGLDIYLIDWGYPDYADRYTSLSDYIHGYINNCVDFLRQEYQSETVNILGVCQGGTFSTCYSALYPKKVNTLITMVTPIDFHTPDNTLSILAKNIDVDTVVDLYGNIPGSVLNDFFAALKPMMLGVQKVIDLPHIMSKDHAAESFMRMQQWISDSPDQCGEAYREFIKDFYQDNKLIENKIKLDGQKVTLSKLTMPILNIYATLDHLVPPASSQALKEFVSTKDYEEFAFQGGHIGIYVSSKSQELVPPKILSWLKKRD